MVLHRCATKWAARRRLQTYLQAEARRRANEVRHKSALDPQGMPKGVEEAETARMPQASSACREALVKEASRAGRLLGAVGATQPDLRGGLSPRAPPLPSTPLLSAKTQKKWPMHAAATGASVSAGGGGGSFTVGAGCAAAAAAAAFRFARCRPRCHSSAARMSSAGGSGWNLKGDAGLAREARRRASGLRAIPREEGARTETALRTTTARESRAGAARR